MIGIPPTIHIRSHGPKRVLCSEPRNRASTTPRRFCRARLSSRPRGSTSPEDSHRRIRRLITYLQSFVYLEHIHRGSVRLLHNSSYRTASSDNIKLLQAKPMPSCSRPFFHSQACQLHGHVSYIHSHRTSAAVEANHKFNFWGV